MMSETYRGYRCYFINPLGFGYNWRSIDDKGRIMASGATLDELKAEIDEYLEDE